MTQYPSDLEDRISRQLHRAYAIQLTGGTHDDYTTLIHDLYPEPRVEVDCATIDSFDDFLDTITDDLTTAQVGDSARHINKHFAAEEGSLVLYNFDEMDDDTIREMAMYLKGLWEDLNYSSDPHIAIAITTDDASALFAGNGDLAGRVLTLNLTEHDTAT